MNEILPDKFTPARQTVVGQASFIASQLQNKNMTIAQLFSEFKQADSGATFDSFVTALTFLYGAGALDYRDGIVRLQ
ncbi:ABC-three component system middle component 6 [Pseudolysinimonas sp.]|uniref:ABC-three component system middle component 6 n=1 Tax=Pseudolysinimonas sp. TaxID=2680009 RepID=UPI0037842492